MSGICGAFALDGGPPPSLEPMLETLRRRGPDGDAVHLDGPCALGHARLATTPEAAVEAMPWRHPETGCVVTADIRLDNRDELIPALGLASAGRIIGDGELALRAWLAWGEGCLDRLLGDFAFAIWDPRARRLFCARDHVGMRQLTYAHVPGRLFAFATEPRAVVRTEGVPDRLNEMRVADFLLDLETADLTSTFHEGVLRLPPAHLLTVGPEGLSVRRYWALEAGEPLRLPSDEAYAEAFLEVFTEAVRARLRSAGPVGSMLSGGLDSSSVVAVASRLIAEAGGPPLRTYSAVGPDPETCIETRSVHAALEMPHLTPTLVCHADLAEMADGLVADGLDLEEPFDVGMNLIRAVYRSAHSAGIKVMLDGVASDSVLTEGPLLSSLLRTGRIAELVREVSGHGRFWGAQSEGSTKLLLQAAREVLAPDIARRAKRRLTRRFGPTIDADPPIADGFRPLALERLRTLTADVPTSRPSPIERRVGSIAGRALTVGRERYDRVAGALAIEPRDPFMDRRLIDLSLRSPDRMMMRGGWPKYVLRLAAPPHLPDAVRWRRGRHHLGLDFTQRVFGSLAGRRSASASERRRAARYVSPSAVPTTLPIRSPGLYAAARKGRDLTLRDIEMMSLWLWLETNENGK